MNLLLSGIILEISSYLPSSMICSLMATKQILIGSYARSMDALSAKTKNTYDPDKIWTTWAWKYQFIMATYTSA